MSTVERPRPLHPAAGLPGAGRRDHRRRRETRPRRCHRRPDPHHGPHLQRQGCPPRSSPGAPRCRRRSSSARTTTTPRTSLKIVREEFGAGGRLRPKITYKSEGKPTTTSGTYATTRAPDRRHRRHDRHRHRHQAARVPRLHAVRQSRTLLRADERPRRPHHRSDRSAGRHAGAPTKDHFVIVDCVGVTERGPRLDGGEAARPRADRATAELLQQVATGITQPDLLSTSPPALTPLEATRRRAARRLTGSSVARS